MNFPVFLLFIFEFFVFAQVHSADLSDFSSAESEEQKEEKKPVGFWANLLEGNGIGDDAQIGQMAKAMDEDEPIIEQLSDEANYIAPPSPAHPTFKRTYSKKYGSPTEVTELTENDLDKSERLEKRSWILAKISRSLKNGNFYLLFVKFEKLAKSLQKAAKNFVMLRELVKANEGIGPKFVEKIDKMMKQIAAEKGKTAKKYNQKMELSEILKKMASIVWTNKNLGKKAQEMVQLWHLTKKNGQFNEYLKQQKKAQNKKGNNRRQKRLDPLISMLIVLLVACAFFFCFWQFLEKVKIDD